MLQHHLSEQDEETLAQLNLAVREAIRSRERWLDEKMSEYAGLTVGGKLYNLVTGELEGTVTEIYRTRRNAHIRINDPDERLQINYWWTTSRGGRFNTEGQCNLGDRQDRDNSLQRQLRILQEKIARNTQKGNHQSEACIASPQDTVIEPGWVAIADRKPPADVTVWLYWGRGPDAGLLCEGHRGVDGQREYYACVYDGSIAPTHWHVREQLPSPPIL
jgi:hypothetical protein